MAVDHKQTDEEIIHLFRNSHDLEYLNQLFYRYHLILYGAFYHYLQDSKMARESAIAMRDYLIKDLKKHGVENFKSWLYYLVKKMSFQQLLKKNPGREKELKEQFGFDHGKIDYHELRNVPMMDEKTFQEQLDKGLVKTKKKVENSILEDFYLQKEPVSQVAQKYDMEIDQVLLIVNKYRQL